MSPIFLIDPGPRPSCAYIAKHLWGADCDVDSDGNSVEASDKDWTELTLTLRPNCQERVDIDPLDDLHPLVLVIKSENDELTNRTSLFLHSASGGDLSESAPDGRGNGS